MAGDSVHRFIHADHLMITSLFFLQVMVRSSANCEDLQKMSGAGLYDSIANVDSSNADAVAKAVSLVWQVTYIKGPCFPAMLVPIRTYWVVEFVL